MLQTFASSFTRAASGKRSVALGRIVARGTKAAALVEGSRQAPAEQAVTRQRVKAWSAAVPDAVSALRQRLAAGRTACPDQQIVLVGHAQGAMAVHRVLATLDNSYTQQVVGAALIADGDREAATRAKVVGAPAASRAGRGVAAAKLKWSVADVPTRTLYVPTYSVCTSGDLVCDLRGNPARDALSVHAGYTQGGSATRVRRIAQRLWARTMAWPRPADLPRSVVPVNSRFSAKLPVDVGSAKAATVVWENVSGLPAGATLSTSGLLSGQLPSAGSWTVNYTLRNTRPYTPTVAGSMVLSAGSDPAQLSSGGRTSCEVRADASAWCWGDNRYGQVGDGTTLARRKPVKIGIADWSSVTTSGATTCGIKLDRSLWCWGMNNRGQVGIGGTVSQRSPVLVAPGRTWSSVSTGWVNTCALATDGSAWCWGDGAYGQLGVGNRSTRDRPQQVGARKDWTQLVVGGYQVCGLKTGGTALCWGQGSFGQLGNGSTSGRMRPGRVLGTHTWQRLYAGWYTTCGLDSSGSAWCWGLNDKGQVGDGTRANRAAPVAVGAGLPWTSLAVGDRSVCGLSLAGGALCWGGNRYGQLGLGSTEGALRPRAVVTTDTWGSIEAGWFHVCARTLTGRRSCWGNNERGQLGVGDTENRSSPRGVAARFVVPSTLNRRDPSQFTATTLNVLGSEKTEPGGGAPDYAPGRLRTDWLADYLVKTRSGIVGYQELMDDQLNLLKSMFPTYAFWPGMENGIRGAWTTVMWDGTVWEKLSAEAVMIPFRGKQRPTALVLLRNKVTGKQLWVFNVHNSAHNTAARRAERLEAMKIEVAKIKEKRATGTPLLLLGDLNEHKRAFCFITGRTDLRSVTGGRGRPTCVPPPRMRVDWVFASKKVAIRGFQIDNSAEVEGRITDHAVVHGRLSL